jgi:hypothetical protein
VSKALCSIGAGPHAQLLEISRPTFAAFAERHGYELITSAENTTDRPPAWGKVPMLREALASYDRVLWIDADAVIVDASQDIPLERDLALVRHRRGEVLVPNTGVMAMRSGGFAEGLLDELWGSKRFIHHPWWENAALLHVFGYQLPSALERGFRRLRRRELAQVRPSPYLEHTQFLPPEWNAVHPDRPEHPRIVHFPGVPLGERLREMTAALT